MVFQPHLVTPDGVLIGVRFWDLELQVYLATYVSMLGGSFVSVDRRTRGGGREDENMLVKR